MCPCACSLCAQGVPCVPECVFLFHEYAELKNKKMEECFSQHKFSAKCDKYAIFLLCEYVPGAPVCVICVSECFTCVPWCVRCVPVYASCVSDCFVGSD